MCHKCKLNYCLISWLKIGVHVLERNFQAAHWPHNLANFPSPVNLTDFPLEQQAVPSVPRSKTLPRQVNFSRHVAADGGRSWFRLHICMPWTVPDLYSARFSLQSTVFVVRSRTSAGFTSNFSRIATVTARSRLFVTPILKNLRIFEISL